MPAEILNKDERPTDEEWATLAEHPAHAAAHLGAMASWLGPWLGAATEHHERWDGFGYPLGLAGNEISLAGRIVAVADAYDTMTSKRSYKPAIAPELAKRELVDSAGTHFDPEIVRAFLNVSLGRRWMGGFVTWLTEVPAISSAASNGLGAAMPAAIASAAMVVGSVAPGLLPASADPDLALAVPPPSTIVSESFEASAPTSEVSGAEVGSTSPEDVPAPSSTALPRTVPASTTTTVPASTTTTVPASTTTTASSTTAKPSTTVPPEDSDFAIDDEFELETGKKENLEVLDNDGDKDFLDTLDEETLEIVSGPSHANTEEFRVHDDHVHYESIDGFVGTDAFRYRICTFDGACGIATVTIRVIEG